MAIAPMPYIMIAFLKFINCPLNNNRWDNKSVSELKSDHPLIDRTKKLAIKSVLISDKYESATGRRAVR
jgi:hypothetical protein